MNDFSVRIVTIDEIMPHPNADRLELARVLGWVMVVGKGEYKAGQGAVLFPIDSVLPPELEARLFQESKIKLSNGRVRTEKIRGVISQGLLAPIERVFQSGDTVAVGVNIAEQLGVKKYEPKANDVPAGMRGPQVKKRDLNPHFHEYHDIPRIKNCPYLIQDGEFVEISEKIHGTNFRAGWVPFVPRTWWQRIKGWFGRNPAYEFVYGSRRVQLQYNRRWNGFYTDNVYAEAVRNYDLETRLPQGVVIYGEIYGDEIQKGYTYGLSGKRGLVVFDIEVDGVLQSPSLVQCFAHDFGLPTVPILYYGSFSMDVVTKLASGASVLSPSQAVREGVVVKTITEPRRVVKVINEEYDLLQAKHDGTDFH